ncbi:hypothetical protein C5167_029573 [Papaver somniferum]|nr:hypothetical protein C5167_029573 [Papaver somniferum]
MVHHNGKLCVRTSENLWGENPMVHHNGGMQHGWGCSKQRAESPAADGDPNFNLNNKSTTQPRETMQLDDETKPQEYGEHNGQHDCTNTGEAGGKTRTTYILTSEVVGSWEFSTASVHGENENERRGVRDTVGSGN